MYFALQLLLAVHFLFLLTVPSECIIRGNTSAPNRWPSSASLYTFTYERIFPTPRLQKSCPEIDVVFNEKKLYTRNYHMKCGAVVWDQKTLLTAAHCLDGMKPSQLEVNFDEIDRAILADNGLFEVKHIVMHDDYDPINVYDDIALLRLTHRINPQYRGGTFEASMQYVPWSQVNHTGCIVLGWGRTEDDYFPRYLREVVINLESSSNGWGTIYSNRTSNTGGICGGDSGGPIFCPLLNDTQSYSLVGISSTRADKHCRKEANRGRDGFAFVEHYLDWIEKTIQLIDYHEYLEEVRFLEEDEDGYYFH